jgi:hypothetical protein
MPKDGGPHPPSPKRRFSKMKRMLHRRLTSFVLVALVAVAAGPGATTATAQTEPRPELVGPAYDAFAAAARQFAASVWIAEHGRRLSEVLAVQANLHRLVAEYPDSLAEAVFGPSLHGDPGPAAELEQYVADLLAWADGAAARLEANRATREARCPEMPDACALIAEAQVTTDAIRADEGSMNARVAGEQRFAALSAIALAQAAMGLVDDAKMSLGDALVAGPDVRDFDLLVRLARALAASGDGDSARATFALAAEQIDRHYDFATASNLSTIGTARAAAGMADDARRSFAEARALQDGRYSGLVIEAEIAAGMLDDALDAARQLPDAPARAGALANIAAAQANAGTTEDARAIVAEAAATIATIADEALRGAPLTRLANARLAAGQPAEADTTLAAALAATARMADEVAQVPILFDIASVRTAAGSPEAARQVLADAVARVDSFADARWRAVGLTNVATRLLEAGFIEEARATFLAAAQDDSEIAWVAIAQARAGLTDDALASFTLLQDETEGNRRYVLARIAEGLAAAGRLADARAVADRILEVGNPDDPAARNLYFHARATLAEAQAAAAAAAVPAED